MPANKKNLSQLIQQLNDLIFGEIFFIPILQEVYDRFS